MSESHNDACLAAFNDETNNRNGERVRVILITAEQHSEGISLKHVRRIILADLSAGNVIPRWTQVQQRIGRALRMCSHEGLPPALRTLTIDVFVAVHRMQGFPILSCGCNNKKNDQTKAAKHWTRRSSTLSTQSVVSLVLLCNACARSAWMAAFMFNTNQCSSFFLF